MTAFQRSRSDDPAEVGTSPALDVTVDGQRVTAHAGQTVAAVLLANGRDTWRTTRVHQRPRGVFCGIGACQDCLVTVNGLPDVRACQRTITTGDTITTQPGPVLPTADPPASTTPASTTPGGAARTTEVLVVGAGPAGISAALAAADAGTEVLVVDSGRAVGGQYHRQLPEEFAARRPDRLQHEWKAFAAQRDRFSAHPRITYLPETSVWAVEGLRLWAHTGPADASGRRPFAIDAQAVVLAAGAFDRVLPFPGWDLPGVYTAGAAQALAKGQRIAVGRRVLVAGTGPFLLPVAESLLGVGAQVIGLLEANSLRTVRKGWSSDPLVAPSKLREAAGYGALLARHRIPLRHGWTVIAADGADRVEAATIARLDDDWRPVPGSGRRVAVDAICVGFGFTANLELAVSARCTLTTGPDGGPAVSVDANQQTSAAGFFAAGELTGIGGAALSAAEGAVAGTSAARHVTSAAETRLADPSAARHSTSPAESTLGGASAERYVRSAAEGALAEASAARYVASAAEPPAQATADSAVEKGSVDPAVEDGAADAAVARGAAGPAVEDGAADAAGAVDPAVVRGRRFAGVLARAYPVRDGWKSWSTAATIVCRCEEVTRGELEDAASTRGLADGRAMKLSSRAGLGMCQGRVCSRTVAALLAGPGEVPSPSMKRPIAVPVRLRDLAAADVARVNQDVEHDRVAESAETMEEQ